MENNNINLENNDKNINVELHNNELKEMSEEDNLIEKINYKEEIKLSLLALVFDRDLTTFIQNLDLNLIQDIPDELIVILCGTKFLDYDKLQKIENKYSLLFKNFKLIKFEKRKSDSFLFLEGLKHVNYENISIIFGRDFYHKQRNKIIKYMIKEHNPKILIHSFLYEYCWRQNKLINTINLNDNIYTEDINKESIKSKKILKIYKDYSLKDSMPQCKLCKLETHFFSDNNYNFCSFCLSEIYDQKKDDFPKCPVCDDTELIERKKRNKKNFINDYNYHHYFIDPIHLENCVNCKNKKQIYFKNINEEDFKDIEMINNDELIKFNFNHDLINPNRKVIFGMKNNEQIYPDTLSFTFKKELIDIFLFYLDNSLNINHSSCGFQNLLIQYLLKENYKIILLNSKLSIKALEKRYPEEKHFKHLEKSDFRILKDGFYDGKNNRSWYEYLYIDKAICDNR